MGIVNSYMYPKIQLMQCLDLNYQTSNDYPHQKVENTPKINSFSIDLYSYKKYCKSLNMDVFVIYPHFPLNLYKRN